MLTKADFELDPDVVFLNHGSFGACSTTMLQEQFRWIQRLERQPVLFHRELPGYMRSAREALAEYVGVETNDLVAVINATHAANVVIKSLIDSLEPGSEILTTSQEYGACMRALEFHAKHKNINIVRINIDLPAPSTAEIAATIKAGYTVHTRILFISHITSPAGFVMPVKELCSWAREQNIISVVDGAHAPGMFDLNIPSLCCDIYFANCHKWMCTPKGSAFLWVHPEIQYLISPLLVSWGRKKGFLNETNFIDEHEFIGTRDPSAFLCVPYAIQWMKENNWESIQNNARELVAYGLNLFTAIPNVVRVCNNPEQSVLMLGAVLLPDHLDASDLKEWLYQQKIEVVAEVWQNNNIVRISAHVHTTKDDIEYCAEKLSNYITSKNTQ